MPKRESDDGSGLCWHCFEIHAVYDSRADKLDVASGAYLPHSCDEWYIGGRPEIEALITDLKAAWQTLGEEGK